MAEDKVVLAKRIDKSDTGFTVSKGSEHERKLYYGTYSFKDEADFIPELEEIAYWKPMEDCEIVLKGQECLVYVSEKLGEETVEDTRFYWTDADRKPRLQIVTQPANKKYGKQAFEIVITWVDGPGEPFNNEYIYLSSDRGEKFCFLKKEIGGPGKKEDRYIYIVPEGFNPDSYSVSVLPQLREKYNIIIE